MKTQALKLCVAVLLACLAAALPLQASSSLTSTRVETSGGGLQYVTETTPDFELSTPSMTTVEESDPSVMWHQQVTPAIYDDVAMAKVSDLVAAGTYNHNPMGEILAIDGDGNPLMNDDGPDNSKFQVKAAGETVVTIENIPDGWNLTSIVKVYKKGSKKPTLEHTFPGYGTLAICPKGKFWSWFGIVNNSYVVPGSGQIVTYAVDAKEPTMVYNLEHGEQPVACSDIIDSEVAYTVGVEARIINVFTGDEKWRYARKYAANSIGFSGEYIAFGFDVLEVFKRNGDTFEEFWTGVTWPWLVNQVQFSPDKKRFAVAYFDGPTAQQNRLSMFDVTANEFLAWEHVYEDVKSTATQNVIADLEFDVDGHYLALANWGDSEHITPQISVLCAECGKILFNYTTEGSMNSIDIVATEDGFEVVAGGKQGHNNLMGKGGDLYSLKHKLKHDRTHALVSDAVVAEINSKQSSWTARVHKRFEGLTLSDARKYTGTFINDERMSSPRVHTAARKDIPKSFDASKQWPECVHAIRDQGQCGSCWAFGASEAFSDRLCIASKNKTNLVLSAEDLVSCDTANHGCGGGWLLPAWEFMEKKGLVSESCYPYVAGGGVADDCRSECVDEEKFTPYKIKEGSLQYFGSEQDIQTAIMTDGPVEAGFNVYSDFFSYASGVYEPTTDQLAGGHAVKIVGWGTESGKDYWIVSNSWGTEWGMEGQFWIRRGTNCCGIEYNTIWGLPSV